MPKNNHTWTRLLLARLTWQLTSQYLSRRLTVIFFCHVCVKIALPVSVFTFSTPAYLYLRFPYLHFPPLQFVLRFFVLAYSIPRYLRFTCIFSRPISAPRLGVYYFFVVDSVCLYVRLCVCLSVTDKLQIASFFCLSMESSHFWPTVLHVALYETVFLDFDLGSLTQKFTPPNLHKIAYDSASTADIQAVWAYYGVFGDGRFNATMQNVVGPTLVAMATTFGLGAEIYRRLPACLSVHLSQTLILLFCFSMKSSHFLAISSPWQKLYTNLCSSVFDLGPLTQKIYSPKFGTKSPISRLVWQIDGRCFGPYPCCHWL